MSDIPSGIPKGDWPFGGERVCDGSIIHHGRGRRKSGYLLHTSLTPREVRELMKKSKKNMLELPHHYDADVSIYVDRREITAIDARWTRVED